MLEHEITPGIALPKIEFFEPIDTITFRESFSYWTNLLEKRKGPLDKAFRSRYSEIERRISMTTSLEQLNQLDGTKKFYDSTAEMLKIYEKFFGYSIRTFSLIDENYWNTVLHGEKLKKENAFLKKSLSSHYEREELLMDIIKKLKGKSTV